MKCHRVMHRFVLVAGLSVAFASCGNITNVEVTGSGEAVELPITSEAITLYAGRRNALMIFADPKSDSPQSAAILIESDGKTDEAELPPWYGEPVWGSATSQAQDLVIMTLTCDGKPLSEDTTCSSDYMATVWGSNDARVWTKVNEASIPGTAGVADVSVRFVGVSDDATTLTLLVSNQLDASVVRLDGSKVTAEHVESGIKTACLTPDGILGETSVGTELETVTTSAVDGDESVQRDNQLIHIDTYGKTTARTATSLPAGHLKCGTSGTPFWVASDGRTVWEIDPETANTANLAAKSALEGGQVFERHGSEIVMVGTAESKQGDQFVQAVSVQHCIGDNCKVTFNRVGNQQLGAAASLEDGVVLTLVDLTFDHKAADGADATKAQTTALWIPHPAN